jgi:hypothetical protein
MRWTRRNILITPFVLLGVPVTLAAWCLEWLFDRGLRIANWIADNMPRWEQ